MNTKRLCAVPWMQRGFSYSLSPDTDNPALVDYLVYAPSGGLCDFAPYTRAKAVLGLWAGWSHC